MRFSSPPWLRCELRKQHKGLEVRVYFPQSRRLVSWSYFSLYLSWMAGSYEIITFLSVPCSGVRKACRLPEHRWASAADGSHTSSQTLAQAAAANTGATHTPSRPRLPYTFLPRWQLTRGCKVNCAGGWGEEKGEFACKKKKGEQMCARVEGDVTFLGWHEATLCPHTPGASSREKERRGLWGEGEGIKEEEKN